MLPPCWQTWPFRDVHIYEFGISQNFPECFIIQDRLLYQESDLPWKQHPLLLTIFSNTSNNLSLNCCTLLQGVDLVSVTGLMEPSTVIYFCCSWTKELISSSWALTLPRLATVSAKGQILWSCWPDPLQLSDQPVILLFPMLLPGQLHFQLLLSCTLDWPGRPQYDSESNFRLSSSSLSEKELRTLCLGGMLSSG